jgi:PEP-CTERM motif
MFCRFVVRSAFIALALGLGSVASAGVIWNETGNGDLSGDHLAPTVVGTLTHGSNQIFGQTGNPGSPDSPTTPDRDYFVITVPVGLHLASITVLPGTTSGNVSFIGLQAGSQFTIPPVPNPSSAAGMLGWFHYSPAVIGQDILDDMSIPNRLMSGNSGFTIPLGPGNYAFWVQDTSGGGPFNYGFDLLAVSEPGTIAMMLLGLGGLGFSLRKRA